MIILIEKIHEILNINFNSDIPSVYQHIHHGQPVRISKPRGFIGAPPPAPPTSARPASLDPATGKQ